jgi:hypothetical protein
MKTNTAPSSIRLPRNVLPLKLSLQGRQLLLFDDLSMSSMVEDFCESVILFERYGMQSGSVKISIAGRELRVYLVARPGFSMQEYQPYLEEMARDEMHLKYLPMFEDVSKIRVGILDAENYGEYQLPNAWHDLDNHVLWVLSIGEQQLLMHSIQKYVLPKTYVV